MILTVLSLIVPVLLPLYFVYHLWTASFETAPAWGLNAANGLVVLGLMFMTGRWDLAGGDVRYVLCALYALAMIGSWTRVPERALVSEGPWCVSWGTLADAVVIVALLGWALVGVWPERTSANVDLPLRGDDYYVVHGGETYPLNYHGLFASSQQYAVDITQLNEWGMRAAGLYPEQLDQYNIYGDSVYSPVSGTVVRAVDRFSDLTPGTRQPEHPAGNHVWVRCDSLYVVLAHLQEGSVQVETGERVQTGQPIGAVGNTGNTSEPHLHVHALAYDHPTSRPDTLHRNGTPVPLAFNGRFPLRNDRFADGRAGDARSMTVEVGRARFRSAIRTAMPNRDDDFLALVHENEGRLRKICRVYADGPAAQRDLYQDILVELWRSLSSFDGAAEPSTWLYRVALNTALSRDRKQSVRDEATLDDANPLWDDAFEPPGAALEEQEALDRLYAAIDRLDDVDKALVTMYLDEKSYDEMADVLGITPNHVGVKLHRIKKKLADWLEDDPS
jgi:RNA polymerase sigma-70 factor (ECF subfamily)